MPAAFLSVTQNPMTKRLHNFTKIVCPADRYLIVIVGYSLIIINIYFPCVGTADRLLVCEEVIANLTLWVQRYPSHSVLIGGALNTDLEIKLAQLHKCYVVFSLR